MKLKILGIEPAVSKKKEVYYKVQTTRGDMSVFDEAMIKAVGEAYKTKEEINLNVVPSPDGRYQNIRGFAMDDDRLENNERIKKSGYFEG